MEQVITPWEKFLQLLPFIIPLVLLQLILMIVALVDLSRREKVRWLPKWAWALIVILGELLGPIVYLILGREE
ncbi:MAG: PLD nuclease N-terminal domain-containing protein [Anaerolineales bacterium]